MGAGDLAPDHSDLGTADLLLSLVDVGDLLAEIEAAWLSEPGTHAHRQVQKVVLTTYLAASVLSTPSILIRLVLGWVTCRLRW